MSDAYPKIAQLKTVGALRLRLDELGLELPIDDAIVAAADDSPLAKPITIGRHHVANRWCIHPMEGWDANRDGSPSELTLRRWRNFGLSGAKLIWGGEAAAVQLDGRANPNQTLAVPENLHGLRQLLDALTSAHVENFGNTNGLLVGLQLTHSVASAGRIPNNWNRGSHTTTRCSTRNLGSNQVTNRSSGRMPI